MSPNRRKGRGARLGSTGLFALVITLVALSAGTIVADPSRTIPAVELERLMVKVKAEHPDARILKVEREAENGASDVYEVKLLRPDGQVLKLYFDVETLAPVPHGDDDTPERRRLREHRRGHW